jgi:ADP-ribose pyrophosphatase YjhB (NUDIX family)
MTQRKFPASPLVAVAAVVVDNLGRVLLVKRGREPMAGHWSLPGGLLELGETLIEGVCREVAEETGLTVQPEAVVEVVDRIYLQEERIRYHYVIVDYWCRVLQGDARAASDAAELSWVTRDMWIAPGPTSGIQPSVLDPLTAQIIEKGWQLAQAAGVHG